MASYRDISDGWSVSDGILRAEAQKAAPVVRMLHSAGLTDDPDAGLNQLKCVWTRGRSWKYEREIEFEGTDERARLALEGAKGKLAVSVNGVPAEAMEENEFELTGGMREGKNALEIVFAPDWENEAAGFSGARLITYNFARLRKCVISLLGARLEIAAHVSGRYRFSYSLARGAELYKKYEFEERLRAADNALFHPFDAEPGEYRVKLEITRGEVSCESAWRDIKPVSDASRGFRPDGYEADIAFVSPAKLVSHAGGEPIWPLTSPFYAYRCDGAFDVSEYEMLFSSAVSTEPERLARLSRYLQADRLFMRAVEARRAGREFFVNAGREESFTPMSRALIEADGARRPAHIMLMAAWSEVCAYPTDAEGNYELLRENPLGAINVTCETYDVCEGIKLSRAVARDAYKRELSRVDRVFVTCAGEFALLPLLDPPLAMLRAREGRVTNVGSAIALGVFAGDYYGALLPGESVEAESFECLNSY